MSLIKPLINTYLRLKEKPMLASAEPDKLRRAFERHARLFFWPPRGTVFGGADLGSAQPVGASVSVNAHVDGPLLLYFHGGAYIFGSPRTHKAMIAHLAKKAGCPAILPGYRLAPEHAFPAPLEDALAAYRAVMDHPGGVVLGGDSAGGGLALALLAQIIEQGLRQPIGTFVFSPLTDMTFSAPSVRGNDHRDVLLPASRTPEFSENYLQGADPADPRASPLFGDFAGAGPVWCTVADREILLDDSLRMVEKLRAQGVDVTFEVVENLPHVWPIFHNILPEARATLHALAQWIIALSPPSGDS